MVGKDRFFIQGKKQQQQQPAKLRQKKPLPSKEEITSGSEDESANEKEVEHLSDSESDHETAASKRLRLAKEYLENLQERQDEFSNGALQEDREIISKRLKSDQLESTGRLFRILSERFNREFHTDPARLSILKGSHALSVTQVVVSESGALMFSASKDGSIVKWDPKTGKKLALFPQSPKGKIRHSDPIFALALSSDAKLLASGSKNGLIAVHCAETGALLKTFNLHKDSITGLAFRRGNAQLFSGSLDRSVKLWNMESMAFVETLFGHQEGILDIDSLVRERCISVAGRDRSLHLYKILEESQLIFRADDHLSGSGSGSIECCSMLDEEHFICGSDGGHLLIFSIAKKKPLLVQRESLEGEASAAITCIGKVLFSDLLITATQSGRVKVWKISEKKDSLNCLCTFEVNGFPNAISTSFDGKVLAVAVGKEPRLGRWETKEKAVNAVYLYRMLD